MDTPFDLIVYGATGFTGAQGAAWIAAHAPAGLRWAIAGRSRSKLEAVAARVGGPAIVVADGEDEGAIDALVRSTRVVLSFAGPYARYGSALVGAVARHGRRYCDITGETVWVKRMIAAHGDAAVASGAVIVPFCGFDSVPSDLGVQMLVDALAARGEATAAVRSAYMAKGGVNGGTIASAMNLFAEGSSDWAQDPFLLSPPGHGLDPAHNPVEVGPAFDADLQRWVAPFFMAPVNGAVERWSAALAAAAGRPYGPQFGYAEALSLPGPWSARAAALGMRLADGMMKLGPARSLIGALAPAPGEGPSEETMDRGSFSAEFVAIGVAGTRLRGRVAGQGDPGNRSTVRMAGSAALTLLSSTTPAGGIFPPAFALGTALRDRLVEEGMIFQVYS